MKTIEGQTLVDTRRCFMLYQYVKHVTHVPGDLAEIGVYKGGTARLLAKAAESTEKTLHLFDTFAGMPPSDPTKDFFTNGSLTDTSLTRVQAFLSDCPRVQFYPGVFPDTATPVAHLNFSLVHIDVDIYQSVLACCQVFYPRMAKGGVLVFDDYGFLTCRGGKMAVDEFFADRPAYPCYLPTGQAVVIKL
jgi:O-methyltransferase